MKTCSKCKVSKPFSEYYKDKSRNAGLTLLCKECFKERARKYSERYRQTPSYKTTKTCYKCKVSKTISDFCLDKHRKDGRSSCCKECAREKGRLYREKYPEKVREQQREYNRTRRKNNPEKQREHCRKYYKKHPEKAKELTRKRRAMKAEIEENYTKEMANATEIAFGFKCFNCGSTESLAHDHNRALSKGYPLEIGNAVLLCKFCNSSKRDKDPEDFYSEEQLADLEVHFKIQRDIFALTEITKHE
jgi:hypothetical protein